MEHWDGLLGTGLLALIIKDLVLIIKAQVEKRNGHNPGWHRPLGDLKVELCHDIDRLGDSVQRLEQSFGDLRERIAKLEARNE